MDASLGLNQSLRTEQNLSPQMLQSLALLPMPILELKAHIQAEIEANPALEIPDSEFSNTLQEGPEQRTLDDRMDDADASDYENMSYSDGGFDPEASDRKQMMIENSSAPSQTLKEHLTEQLGESQVPQNIRTLCEALISNLDQNGFFILPLEELTEKLNPSKEDLEKAVSVV